MGGTLHADGGHTNGEAILRSRKQSLAPVNSKDREKKDVWFGRAKYIIMVTAFSNPSLRVREKIIKNTVSKTIFNKLKLV